jgi:ribosomal protein S18 acetylase RimI-like enzyme
MDETSVTAAPRSVAESMLGGPIEEKGVVLGAFSTEIVGVVGLKLSPRRKARHLATLWGLFVQPAFRRRGIGGRLVRELARHAQAISFLEQIRLMVPSESTDAIKVFQECGYERYGCELRGRKTKAGYHDLDYMQGVLPEIPQSDSRGLARLVI